MLTGWSRAGAGNVYDDTTLAFGRAAFRWAGLPMRPHRADSVARRMSRLLDSFGRPASNPVAWFERARLDRWAGRLVRRTRSGDLRPDQDSVLAVLSRMTDEEGRTVDAHTAAVELQNPTRPTVAVARFAAFAAIALVENPRWAERIRDASARSGRLADIPEAVAFAQEVRRLYPFVPMLPAKAVTDIEVQGCPVRSGDRLLPDILGTNTDPGAWPDAGTFDPSRFLDVDDAEALPAFIPQGGAGVRTGHRCPGEKIAVTALSASVAAMCRPGVRVSGDTDDMTFPWTSLLTRPATGVRVRFDPDTAQTA